MDQTIINWLFAGFGAALGWVMKVVWDAIKTLQNDMKQIERDLPEVYVRKDDFKDAITNVREDMKELRHDVKDGFNEIDRSVTMLLKRLDVKADKE